MNVRPPVFVAQVPIRVSLHAALPLALLTCGVAGCLPGAAGAASPPNPSPSPAASSGAAASSPSSTSASKPAALPPAVSPEEAKIGKEGVKEVEQEYDVVKDPADLGKMQKMVSILEKGTPYPDLKYTVTIVRSKHPDPEPEVNAFSLPGGYIFVTKDLLNSVQSDDELAAVLGHEMAHVVHHHVIRQIKAQNRNELMSLLVILGDLLAEGGHPGEGAVATAMMSQQVVQALQSPHSIHDESEADSSGIDYLHNTHVYNPVGMMTFMQRLALDERRHPDIELGYLQTHPSSEHRVEDIRAKLESLGVKVTPEQIRSVTHAMVAVASPNTGSDTAVVQMQGIQICTFASNFDGMTPLERAEAAAQAINAGLNDGRKMGELELVTTPGHVTVTWGMQPIFSLNDADAEVSHLSTQDDAAQAVHHIQQALWADYVAHN